MDTINIIGVDPGKNTGVSIYTVSVPDLKIVSIFTYKIVLSNGDVTDNSEVNLIKRLNTLYSNISNLMQNVKPYVVAMEAAFMNKRFATAVIHLSQYISAIQLAVRHNNPWVPIVKYPPKSVKFLFGAGGSADKDDMSGQIKKIHEIANMIDIDSLSEHEIDSLAIGYIAINKLREDPLKLITL